jgi:deoxyribose-phosphate aldolase
MMPSTRAPGLVDQTDSARGSLRRAELFLARLGSVDAVALEERATGLASRAIEGEGMLRALELAVSLVELMAVDGAATDRWMEAACARATRPDAADADVPRVAGICVAPHHVRFCRDRLVDTGVEVVAVVDGTGRSVTEIAREASSSSGTVGIEITADSGALLSGRYMSVFDEISATKQVARDMRLIVVIRADQLGTYDNLRRAALLAIAAGADFVGTSVDAASPTALLPAALCVLDVIRDVYADLGHAVGFKSVGSGVTAEEAVAHLVLANDILGSQWLTREYLRLGARGALLGDLITGIREEKTGVYQARVSTALA